MSRSLCFNDDRSQLAQRFGTFPAYVATRRLDVWQPLLATTVYWCSSTPGDMFISLQRMQHSYAANSCTNFVQLSQGHIDDGNNAVFAVRSAKGWQKVPTRM
ncbi:TPA: hypothetical protein ACH3X2_014020 [Trebouxia sp. C0005]